MAKSNLPKFKNCIKFGGVWIDPEQIAAMVFDEDLPEGYHFHAYDPSVPQTMVKVDLKGGGQFHLDAKGAADLKAYMESQDAANMAHWYTIIRKGDLVYNRCSCGWESRLVPFDDPASHTRIADDFIQHALEMVAQRGYEDDDEWDTDFWEQQEDDDSSCP